MVTMHTAAIRGGRRGHTMSGWRRSLLRGPDIDESEMMRGFARAHAVGFLLLSDKQRRHGSGRRGP